MIRRPPISTRTDTLFPYTTLFRSWSATVLVESIKRSVFVLQPGQNRSFGPTGPITRSSRQLAVVAQIVGIFDPACFQEINRRLFDQGGNGRLFALSKVFDLCRQLGFHRRCEIARVRAARPTPGQGNREKGVFLSFRASHRSKTQEVDVVPE